MLLLFCTVLYVVVTALPKVARKESPALPVLAVDELRSRTEIVSKSYRESRMSAFILFCFQVSFDHLALRKLLLVRLDSV